MQTAGGDGELLRVRQPLFQDRMVGEVPILLACQHRNVLLRDEMESDVFNRDALELWIHRDEIQAARFIRFNVMQIAVRLCSDDKWQVRNQRAFLTGNTATAVRLESFGDESHRVS